MGIVDQVAKSIALPIVQWTRPARTMPTDAVQAYQSTRQEPNTQYLCNAPFNNMYFTTTGRVSVCWLSTHSAVIDHWSPNRSIRDIWFGAPFERLRKEVRACNLHTFCGTCEQNITNGVEPLAHVYDSEHPLQKYPQAMELELSNSCNLECVMCQGLLSSSIRKNREKKPPLKEIYNEQFVRQMDEFLPHLKRLRFSGGEPTRQKVVFQIIDRIETLCPDLPVTITTNGTTFGKPIVRLFERINVNVGVSLDSLTKEIYEEIRINGNFDRVLAHTIAYAELSQKHGRTMTIQMNPMRMNWHETPEYVRFCNKHHIWLSFNTVQHPKQYAIWPLPKTDLRKMHDRLAGEVFDRQSGNHCHESNESAYWNFVRQIEAWAAGTKENAAY